MFFNSLVTEGLRDEIAYMKNIQVIDSALNCGYTICRASEADFLAIFPKPGQDIEFVEDLARRVGNKVAGQIVLRSTTQILDKKKVRGIHGTLFFGLREKKKYYKNKREADLIENGSLLFEKASAGRPKTHVQ